jgi:dolichol-phosphate mannosyltransferase
MSARNIADLVAQLTALLDPELSDDYELIVVDDDSPDRTWERRRADREVSEAARDAPRDGARAVDRRHPRMAGARGEVLAVIDADLQHPPEVTVIAVARDLEGGRPGCGKPPQSRAAA